MASCRLNGLGQLAAPPQGQGLGLVPVVLARSWMVVTQSRSLEKEKHR